jgi:tRNA (Thr-GGU) A37 N-methylase
VIDERYQPALLSMEALDAIWVFYWFDGTDTPAARSVLQVHPQGNPENPLHGVVAPWQAPPRAYRRARLVRRPALPSAH